MLKFRGGVVNILSDSDPTTLIPRYATTGWSSDSGGDGVESIVEVSNIITSHGFQILNNTKGNRDFSQTVPYENKKYIFTINAKNISEDMKTTLQIRCYSGTGYLFRDATKTIDSTQWTPFAWVIDLTSATIAKGDTDKNLLQFGIIGAGSVIFSNPRLVPLI